MKKLLLIAVIIFAGWNYFSKKDNANYESISTQSINNENTENSTYTDSQSKYYCDGRQYCSQMHSCEEAMFFINNCPDTKMDGNHDGIPCEKQWCVH